MDVALHPLEVLGLLNLDGASRRRDSAMTSAMVMFGLNGTWRTRSTSAHSSASRGRRPAVSSRSRWLARVQAEHEQRLEPRRSLAPGYES
ncbi:hypothetical protein AQJ84_04565 [Streptomyces resistomycificus]|nr:hypothetical protein AQJ84_04565 [Streptomyces resistomycificus]